MTKIKDITQDQARQTLSNLLRKTNHKGCMLACKASGHKNGYVKAKVKGIASRSEFYVHQLAVVADGRGDQLDNAGQGGTHECSHTCREVNCFNSAHIVVEDKETNKERNFCVCLECPCCKNKKVTNCLHQPPCIF